MLLLYLFIFFFFQAEDGIRDWSVIGVQTCALPIWSRPPGSNACRLLSRPNPEALTPPKGTVMSPSSKQLTHTVPALSARAVLWATERSRVQTEAADRKSVV